MRAHATTAALIEAASAPYWKTDFFGYFKARGKLRGDPAFAGILREGLLTGMERILDLGCGQGLLAAWLEAAQRRNDERPHEWPQEWPAPPRPISFRGIELQARDVWRARLALGKRAEFEVGNIADADFGSVDASDHPGRTPLPRSAGSIACFGPCACGIVSRRDTAAASR